MTSSSRPGRAGPAVEPDGLQHHAVPRIEACAGRRALGGPYGFVRGGCVRPPQQRRGTAGTGLRDLQGPVRVQPRAEHVVPVEQRLKGFLQPGAVHRRWNTHGHGLVERLHGAAEFTQPVHDRRGRQDTARRLVGYVPVLGDRPGHAGQVGDRLVGEHVPDAEQQTGGPHPADELDEQDAVPAKIEQVVVDAHLFQSEEFGDRLAQHRLGSVAGRSDGSWARVLGGCREGPAVDLAVACQGQFGEFHECGGHHGRGQERRQLYYGAPRPTVPVRPVPGQRSRPGQGRPTGPAGPRPPRVRCPGTRPAPPRSRRVRPGGHGSSSAGRSVRGTPVRHPAGSGPGPRCGTSAPPARRRGRPRNAPPIRRAGPGTRERVRDRRHRARRAHRGGPVGAGRPAHGSGRCPSVSRSAHGRAGPSASTVCCTTAKVVSVGP